MMATPYTDRRLAELDRRRQDREHGVPAKPPCNCATFGSAAHCSHHTQADYDAANAEQAITITLPQRVWQVVEDQLVDARSQIEGIPGDRPDSDDPTLSALDEAIAALKGERRPD